MTNTEALKEIYNALGGNEALEGASNLDVLNAIAELNGGTAQDSNAKAIKEIADNPPSGGGGSSDFSTATVTFINSAAPDRTYDVTLATVGNDPDIEDAVYSGDGRTVIGGSQISVVVPLYKGRYVLPTDAFADVDFTVMPTTTGGVTVSDAVYVTGDGTITLAGKA